jgi:undecaprenyl diphosphate synthase
MMMKEDNFLPPDLRKHKLPRHIAIIMDGNGRWAIQRNLPRLSGHRAGAKSVREVVESCARIGIPILTLFTFSTENWNRPREEIRGLMDLLKDTLKSERKTVLENNIKFRAIGNLNKLPSSIQKMILKLEEDSSSCTGMIFNIALNYSGRSEIVEAARLIAEDIVRGKFKADQLDEKLFQSYLYTNNLDDPDLLIRTSGEYRISNFLLWQMAYSELWITDVFWPDFRKEHLFQALRDYQKRERRFGGIKSNGS